VAQLASALAWGARGRLFESDHPDIEKMRVCDEQALFYFRDLHTICIQLHQIRYS